MHAHHRLSPHTPTARAFAYIYIYKHGQRHTFYVRIRAHTFTLGSCLAVPSRVSQSMLDLADSDSCHSSISTGGYARQTPCKATYTLCPVCVCVGGGCVHMCLSMRQWSRLMHFMLYSTKMHAVTAFSQGGLVVKETVPLGRSCRFDSQCLVSSALDVVP